MVVGTLCQHPVVLANAYAPNHDDEDFMKKLLSSIPKLHSHHLILGGDMNTVLNPLLDKSNPKTATPAKMAQTLSQFMSQYSCIDPWRSLHPTDKQFSFFSHVHKTHSRIDYFIIDKSFLSSAVYTNYFGKGEFRSLSFSSRFEL